MSFDPGHDCIEVELTATPSPDAKTLIVNFGDGNDVAFEIGNQKVKGLKIDGCPKAGESFTMRLFIDRAQWNLLFNDGLSYHHYARRDSGQPLNRFRIMLRDGGSVRIDSLKIHEVKSVWNRK